MNKTVLYLLFILFTVSVCNNNPEQAATDPASRETIVAFTHVNIIPMTSEEVLQNQTVIVEGEKIKAIGADLEVPEGATVIDGSGKYLMPGLAEMHAHIPNNQDGNDMAEETLFLYLSNGITTIRGMLGVPYHLELRESVAKGEVTGPRIYTAGPAFNGNSVSSPDTARQMVQAQKEAGYDFLKILPGISLENFNVIAETAQEVGIPFAGHVPVAVGIRRAIEAEYASIDHLDGFLEGLVPPEAKVQPDQNGFFGINFTDLADTSRIRELAQATKAAGVWVVPTQSLLERWAGPDAPDSLGQQPEMKYMAAETVDDWMMRKQQFMNADNYTESNASSFNEIRRQIIKVFHEEGVGLLLGSDAPQVFNVPGFSIHHELDALIRSGLTPYEALKTGTANPAVYFDAKEEFGTLVPGASADMILVNTNPLENVKNVQDRAGVMVRGKWLPEEEIQQRLEGIAEKYKR